MVTHIPNVDHRHGDGRAEVLGIAVLNSYGQPLGLLEPLSTGVVRISVRMMMQAVVYARHTKHD